MNSLFTDNSWEDYLYWQQTDKKILHKINKLIHDIKRTPFVGSCWSRRINDEHRLVYEVVEDTVRIITCRYHYQPR